MQKLVKEQASSDIPEKITLILNEKNSQNHPDGVLSHH
jgi:hypothetical protein